MNTNLFGLVFPELLEEYGNGKRLDLRCGLNKEYLSKGHLRDDRVSSVQFHAGDKVEADMRFGCAIYVFDEEARKGELESLFDLFSSLNTDIDDPKWSVYRSFFASAKLDIQLELGEHVKKFKHVGDHLIEFDTKDFVQKQPFIVGRIKDIKPTIHELKIFKREQEIVSEARTAQDKIDELYNRRDKLYSNPAYKALLDTVFGQSIPLSPFPEIERCLGVNPADSNMRIEEGYIVMAFDFDIEPAEQFCLFDMDKYKDLSNRDNRDYRRAKYASKLGLTDDHDASLLRKMSKKAKLPKVKILGHEIDPSKGFGGLIDSVKDMATKPQAAGDAMQAIAYAKRGFDNMN